jgi:hypothetical protein
MRSLRQTKLFTEFASYSKQREAERREEDHRYRSSIYNNSNTNTNTIDDGEGAVGANSETMARAHVALGSDGFAAAAPDDPQVAVMLGALNREARKMGWGLYKLTNPVETHSLKAPGFKVLLSHATCAATPGRERKGVWSEFGKPYECGQFVGRDENGEEVGLALSTHVVLQSKYEL